MYLIGTEENNSKVYIRHGDPCRTTNTRENAMLFKFQSIQVLSMYKSLTKILTLKYIKYEQD
jgi:hypothetical protein